MKTRLGCLGSSAGVLKNVHEFPVAARNLAGCRRGRDLLRAHIHEWVPKAGPANCKPDEAWHRGRRGQPLAHLLVVLSAAEDDAADSVAAATARDGDDFFTVL